MSEDYTSEEIVAVIRDALGLQIQRPKSATVALNDDGTNPAVIEYTVPVKVSGQEETYYARRNPVFDETALANNSPVNIELNYDGEYEIIGLNPILGRQAYSGTSPTPNFAFKQHNHQNSVGGGKLNASLIFDDGTVPVEYGGTNIASYAVGDIIYASGATTLSKLAVGSNGNIYHVAGGVPVSGTLNLDTANLSGSLALARGGTNADLSATGAGHLIQATAGANVSVIKDNLTATAAPTTGDDSGDGYAVGSLWLDTTNDNIYMAIDVSVGAAVWEQLNGGGSSPWTTTSNVIHPGVLTDAVAIGASSNATAKLYILEDDPNEIPLRVKAAAGQAISVLYIEDDSGNILFNISESGQVSVNLSETAGGAFIANGTSGTTLLFADAGTNVLHIGGAFVFNELGNDTDARFEGDNDANLLFLNAGTDRVGVGDDTPDGRFAVAGRADEVQTIIRGNGTQTSNILEVQTSAAAVVASVSNAGLISGVQLGLTSGVASTTTPNILIRDTAQNFGHAKGSGSTGLYTSLNGMYSARTTDTTVTTKTAPGTLIATITVPADFFRVGRQIRYEFSGRGECANLDNVMRLVVQDGSTDLIDTRTSTANSTGNVRDIKGEVLITCRSVGGSGSVWVSARIISSLFSEGGGGRDPNTAADTIDTTTSRTFNIRLYWAGTGTNPPTITVSDDYFDIAG